MPFGLFGNSQSKNDYEAHRELHLALFEEGHNGSRSARPGYLVGRIEDILNDARFRGMLSYCEDKQHSGTLLNIFDVAARCVPEKELLEIAQKLFTSLRPTGWELVSKHSPQGFIQYCLHPLCERCPESDLSRLFGILENRGVLQSVASSIAPEYAARIYASLSRGRNPTHKVAKLKASPSWNMLDHKDFMFVDWLDSIDPDLLDALKR